ncbi:MAG: hypothetical protein JWN44_2800 [Myxococcales bacterium]|nr:hypothetical protein [Myxococcales bacterium]
MRYTIVAFLVAAGCSVAKVPVDDDVTAAFTADVKADLPTNTKFLGDLGRSPAPQFPVLYTKKPKYRSVAFWATAGDVYDIWVTSTDGDAIVWLMDFQGNVIASDDDASSDTTDAHIHATLGPSNGHYFIYFREYAGRRAHLSVTATGGHPADATGEAERAWDAASTDDATLAADAVAATSLPAVAKVRYDKLAAKFGGAHSWKMKSIDGRASYFVIGASVEEIFWIDIYDAAGAFVVHGASGDGGWQMTFWGAPQPWDPSGSI